MFRQGTWSSLVKFGFKITLNFPRSDSIDLPYQLQFSSLFIILDIQAAFIDMSCDSRSIILIPPFFMPAIKIFLLILSLEFQMKPYNSLFARFIKSSGIVRNWQGYILIMEEQKFLK